MFRHALDPFDDPPEDDPGSGRAPRDADPDADPDVDPDADPALADALDADFPLGDGVADVTAELWCPYCGEPNEVALDPGSGAHQEYVEDCQVCCQPWRVTVTYHADGSADVWADCADGR